MIRPIHPFPARMAPQLAISELNQLRRGSVVLDPMAGSGTVLRQASELGHSSVGFDMDPLAVLMTRVWTTPFEEQWVEGLLQDVLTQARKLRNRDVVLPWIDGDEETTAFCEYWFSRPQRTELRKIALVLHHLQQCRRSRRMQTAINVLQIALSRIIITKDLGASLARDVSHSRPHKTCEHSDFDVMQGFQRSVAMVLRLLKASPPLRGNVIMARGDARHLASLRNRSVDMVLTSPPYLNAIDYMRGHRMTLVWFGHRLRDLRNIRASSIGTERGPDSHAGSVLFADIQNAMVNMDKLSSRHAAMVTRYSEDLYRMLSEIRRVLKPQARAVLVVGNSCLKGTFIRNSKGVVEAAKMVGLTIKADVERQLPANRRYLPPPLSSTAPLGKRMRTENILTFSVSV